MTFAFSIPRSLRRLLLATAVALSAPMIVSTDADAATSFDYILEWPKTGRTFEDGYDAPTGDLYLSPDNPPLTYAIQSRETNPSSSTGGAWTNLVTGEVPQGGEVPTFTIPTYFDGPRAFRYLIDDPQDSAAAQIITAGTYSWKPRRPQNIPVETRIALDPMRPDRVKVGSTTSISGTLSVPSGQVPVAGRIIRVFLVTDHGDGQEVGTATTDSNGRFVAELPTWWEYKRKAFAVSDTYKSEIPRDSEPGYDYLVSKSVSSRASGPISTNGDAPAPRGRASAWKPLDDGSWNACQPITYRINTRNAPKNNAALIEQALDKISYYTGYRFTYAGTTKKTPYRHGLSWSDFDSRSNLTIAWATERTVKPLSGGVVGLGGAGSRFGSDTYDIGGVVLDSGPWLSRFSARQREGLLLSLYMHELGHAMGLDHTTADRYQVMYPQLQLPPVTRYGAGDARGLSQIGSFRRGCTIDGSKPPAPEGTRSRTARRAEQDAAFPFPHS